MIATTSQNMLWPKLATCAARTASLACSGFLEGWRDELLDAADRQIAAKLRPDLDRDEHQQGR